MMIHLRKPHLNLKKKHRKFPLKQKNRKMQPEAEPAQEPLLEPDLTFESGLQPEFKEEPQSEPEAQLHFEQEPQLQPEVADYQFEAEAEPALDFEADLDTENAIESLIPPMDDTLSHQLDEVM